MSTCPYTKSKETLIKWAVQIGEDFSSIPRRQTAGIATLCRGFVNAGGTKKIRQDGRRINQRFPKYRERILASYVVYTKDYQQAEGVEYIPVYMAQFL